MKGDYSLYENRDLSWLKFNERCLEEAEDKKNPLFERLQFESIWQTNLDEFCMVRIGGHHDRLLMNKEVTDSKSGMTTAEQLDAILLKIHKLLKRVDKSFWSLMNSFAKHKVYMVSEDELSKYELMYAQDYFEKEILPLLSPTIVSANGRFPFIPGGDICVGMLIENKSGDKNVAFVSAKIPTERLVMLPSDGHKFVLCEELIYRFASKIFPKHKILDKTIFRITRNADLDADEAFVDHEAYFNYRDMMETLLKKRVKLAPVRIEFCKTKSGSLIEERLLKRLKLKHRESFHRSMPLELSFIKQIKSFVKDEKSLFFPPLTPQYPKALSFGGSFTSLINRIFEKDVLLSYPFDNINSFIYLLNEAAISPRVKSIKITLYREANHSKIVEALTTAAENGKKVTALVELRARFDENHNIVVSKRLEEAGVNVIYGLEDYKVHSKLLLITLNSVNENNEETETYITQVGTGNYNEVTSRLYTDLSYITARPEFARDAKKVFKALEKGKLLKESNTLMVAPLCLKTKLLELIDEQISIQKNGGKGKIIIKVNSVSDKTMIQKLVRASDAGVDVNLIVRGICCLSLKDHKTRNIKIRSIVGRYLEHSRIYMFGNEKQSRKIYISSADFMTRNIERRVEVGAPILDADAKEYIETLIELMLSDNVKARIKNTDDKYEKPVVLKGEKLINSQLALFDIAYAAAKNK